MLSHIGGGEWVGEVCTLPENTAEDMAGSSLVVVVGFVPYGERLQSSMSIALARGTESRVGSCVCTLGTGSVAVERLDGHKAVRDRGKVDSLHSPSLHGCVIYQE